MKLIPSQEFQEVPLSCRVICSMGFTSRLNGSKRSWVVRVACLLALTGFPAQAQSLIPASRLVDWTPGVSVGVPGGIPTNRTRTIDVTQSPYNADRTGASNATPAIQAAIDAATAGDIVYLPAGKYRVDSTVY